VALFAQAARVKRWFPPERAPYSRRGYREKRRKFARANWKALAVLLVVFAAMGALLSWTMHRYALGAAHASLVLIYVGMTVSIFMRQPPGLWVSSRALGARRTPGTYSGEVSGRGLSGAGSTA